MPRVSVVDGGRCLVGSVGECTGTCVDGFERFVREIQDLDVLIVVL